MVSGPDRLVPLVNLRARPLRIHLAINDYCNIRCPHCLREAPSAKINRNFLGVADLHRLAPWFRHAHIVALAGLGEPFIQKDIFEIIDLIRSSGPTISIITNATTLDEEKAQRLAGIPLLLLNLSIDAGTPEVFERVRRGACFEQVVENIDRLVALKQQRRTPFPVLAINMTLLRDTLDEVEKVVALAQRWGVPVINAQTAMFFPDSPAKDQAVTNRQAQAALARASASASAAGVELRYIPLASNLETLARDEREGNLYDPRYPYIQSGRKDLSTHRFYCPNLWNQFFVEPTGDYMYCCMADHIFQKEFGPLGKVQDTSPWHLWNHPRVTALRRRLLAGDPPEACKGCYALEPFSRRKTLQLWKTDFQQLLQMG